MMRKPIDAGPIVCRTSQDGKEILCNMEKGHTVTYPYTYQGAGVWMLLGLVPMPYINIESGSYTEIELD